MAWGQAAAAARASGRWAPAAARAGRRGRTPLSRARRARGAQLAAQRLSVLIVFAFVCCAHGRHGAVAGALVQQLRGNETQCALTRCNKELQRAWPVLSTPTYCAGNAHASALPRQKAQCTRNQPAGSACSHNHTLQALSASGRPRAAPRGALSGAEASRAVGITGGETC